MSIASFKFDNFIVEFPADTNYTTYDDEYCYGIIFSQNNIKYKLIHNRQVNWNRIFIIENGMTSDLPFREDTWQLLPDSIKVRKKI